MANLTTTARLMKRPDFRAYLRNPTPANWAGLAMKRLKPKTADEQSCTEDIVCEGIALYWSNCEYGPSAIIGDHGSLVLEFCIAYLDWMLDRTYHAQNPVSKLAPMCVLYHLRSAFVANMAEFMADLGLWYLEEINKRGVIEPGRTVMEVKDDWASGALSAMKQSSVQTHLKTANSSSSTRRRSRRGVSIAGLGRHAA